MEPPDRKRCRKMLFQKEICDGYIKMIDRKKKERKRSLKESVLQFPPMNGEFKKPSEKVSFCTFFKKIRKASLAVETALVLPLFFLGMVTLISFMDIYQIQTEHLQKLCERTKEAGMYAYVLDGKGPDKVTLPDVYSYTPVGGLIPLPKVWIQNTITVHAWTGADEQENAGKENTQEEMVYITESGSVYHRKPGCRYLKVSLQQVVGSRVSSMRNTYGEKYAPCESCSRNQRPAACVYITSTGNRYHNQETCSGLKRTIKLVKLSQVGNMHACSSCG